MPQNRVRLDMRVPESILKQINDYKKENSISTRTAAILELIRKGLNQK